MNRQQHLRSTKTQEFYKESMNNLRLADTQDKIVTWSTMEHDAKEIRIHHSLILRALTFL